MSEVVDVAAFVLRLVVVVLRDLEAVEAPPRLRLFLDWTSSESMSSELESESENSGSSGMELGMMSADTPRLREGGSAAFFDVVAETGTALLVDATGRDGV